jgi:hypothetical protein
MWVVTWDIEMRGNGTTRHLDSFNKTHTYTLQHNTTITLLQDISQEPPFILTLPWEKLDNLEYVERDL